MHSQNNKSAKQKYAKASSVLDGAFVAMFVVNLLFKNCSFWDSALYLTIVSVIFAAISGYVAYLYSKLPKNLHEKANWRSASDFSTHPYFTVSIFAIFSVIGVVYLLIW